VWVKKFSEIEIGPPFVFPEGEGQLYKGESGELFVRYYPGSGGELVAELAGDIDVYSAPRLRDLIIDAVDNSYYRLILSLDEVHSLDSTGFGVLVGALKRTRAHDGYLVLVCDPHHEPILKILRITGLINVYDIYDSIPGALAASSANYNITGPHLLFRVYIPSERMYAAEAGRLLTLFRYWLTATRGRGIRQSGYRTALGEMHEFFADASVVGVDLYEQFDSFSGFLTLCTDNESAAVDLLAEMNLSRRKSSDLVSRFSREARRLQVDLRYERERRILSLRQTLEQELVESDIDLRQVSSSQLSALLECFIPGPSAPESLALLAGSQAAAQIGAITVNINPQIISALESTIVQNVQGVVYLGSQAKEILALIDRFGGDDKAVLRSDVYELEDADAPRANRSAARRRLKNFLSQLVGTVHDVGLPLLEKYLEKKLGL
jgi:anti-anti-sigma factor